MTKIQFVQTFLGVFDSVREDLSGEQSERILKILALEENILDWLTTEDKYFPGNKGIKKLRDTVLSLVNAGFGVN